jgi:hypothetical protein
MQRPVPPTARLLTALALALAATAPSAARAAPSLAEEHLQLAGAPALGLDEAVIRRVLLARAAPADGDEDARSGGGGKDETTREPQGGAAAGAGPAKPGSLDFDLLGEAQAPGATPDAGRMKLRRQMLTGHQASGIALLGLQLSTTVLGQLNYQDKFGGSAPPNTDQYRMPHAVMSYATLAAFVATGTLALLAPSPVKKPARMDRVTVHRIAMFTAAAGMAAQAGLGIWTAKREGYLDQEDTARIHLAVGYATLAAVATGVGALVL